MLGTRVRASHTIEVIVAVLIVAQYVRHKSQRYASGLEVRETQILYGKGGGKWTFVFQGRDQTPVRLSSKWKESLPCSCPLAGMDLIGLRIILEPTSHTSDGSSWD